MSKFKSQEFRHKLYKLAFHCLTNSWGRKRGLNIQTVNALEALDQIYYTYCLEDCEFISKKINGLK